MPTITEGETLFQEGRIDEARAHFERIADQLPEDKQAHNNLGVIAFSEFQYGKAAGYFARAIKIDPFFREAIINLCEVFKETGKMESARNLLEVAVVKYPEDSELLILLEQARRAGNASVESNGVDRLSTDISQLRVLQGTYEIANQSHTISSALQAQGMQSKTLCYYPNYLKYKSDYVLDLNQCQTSEEAIFRSRIYAEQMIPQFDIFHFHFGTSLTYDYSDLPILVEKNKKIVTQYWGSEIRMISLAKAFNPYIKVKGKSEEAIRSELEVMSRYVRHCIVGDYELHEYVKDYFDHIHVIPALINTEKYCPDPDRKPNSKFLIVHAPTDIEAKGSKYIEAALKDLVSDFEFEYRPITGMSHEEAMKNYQQADLIVDEMHAGCYGLLSIECMALAKPVITWISEFMKGKYPEELPLISANPDTIKDVLRDALSNREMLVDKGIQGRAYVEKYHDMNKVILQIQDVYRQL